MDPHNEVEICQFKSYLLKKNGAKSGKLSGQNLICISGIFKVIFRWRGLESKVPSLKLEIFQVACQISVTCVFKNRGYWKWGTKVKSIYIQGGILGLVGMWMWAMKHTQAAAVWNHVKSVLDICLCYPYKRHLLETRWGDAQLF